MCRTCVHYFYTPCNIKMCYLTKYTIKTQKGPRNMYIYVNADTHDKCLYTIMFFFLFLLNGPTNEYQIFSRNNFNIFVTFWFNILLFLVFFLQIGGWKCFIQFLNCIFFWRMTSYIVHWENIYILYANLCENNIFEWFLLE